MSQRETWASKFGFLLTTMAFSVGIGNFWRFPYVAGENGGGAFVLVYLAFVLLLGIPLFAVELGIGRHTQKNPVGAFRALRPGSAWPLVGYLALLAITLICAYATFVVGWCLAYAFDSLRGVFAGLDQDAVAARFAGSTAKPGFELLWGTITMVMVAFIVSRGLRKGVEKAGRILLPTLLILQVVLILRVMTLPGAMEGIRYYLVPDFGALGWDGVLAAMGQVFFSIGIGMAAGMTYGSYMGKDMDVPGSAGRIAMGDAGVALLAGIIIFPAVFSFGLAPDAGPSLVFITLPNVFNQIAGGWFFGALFYVCLFTAGLTSLIGGLEALTAWIGDEFGLRRSRATWAAALGVFLLGVPTALSYGPLADVSLFGMGIFALYDFVSSNLALPVGAMLMALCAVWVWGFGAMKESMNEGATGALQVWDWWKPLVGILLPVLVLIILLQGVGLF